MAASFWDSTQRRHWQFSRDELAAERQKLEDDELVRMLPLPEWRHLYIFFNSRLNQLAKRLGVRQRAIATAQVYIKRFYTKIEIRRTNPYLVMATALYLACKMEETPQHIRLVIQEARGLWSNEFVPFDASRLGECEFFLISEMNAQLIIHQPYRTLSALQGDFAMTPDEVVLAHGAINDSFMTDLPLLYPPHVIALTAMSLALIFRPLQGLGGVGCDSSAGTGVAPAYSMAAFPAALQQAQARAAMLSGGSALASPGGTGGGSKAGANIMSIDEKRQKLGRFINYIASSEMDMEAIVNCTQELITLYECQDNQYNEKLTKDAISRFVKARGLDQ